MSRHPPLIADPPPLAVSWRRQAPTSPSWPPSFYMMRPRSQIQTRMAPTRSGLCFRSWRWTAVSTGASMVVTLVDHQSVFLINWILWCADGNHSLCLQTCFYCCGVGWPGKTWGVMRGAGRSSNTHVLCGLGVHLPLMMMSQVSLALLYGCILGLSNMWKFQHGEAKWCK